MPTGAGTTGSEYGLEMVISNDFLTKITDADNKLQKLANTSRTTANTIIAQFQRMGTEGVDTFINKLRVATETLGAMGGKKLNINIGNVTSSADGIVKVAQAMGQMTRSSAEYQKMMQDSLTGKDVQQWQNLANQIRQNNERIKELTQSTKAYEQEMANIRSGKGGFVQAGAKEEYQNNLNTIAALKQKNAELVVEQQQIVKNNQLIKEEQTLQKQLADLAQGKASMGEMRKRAEYEQLVNAYKTGTSELQKQAKAEDEAAKAAAKAVKEQEKANKEAERAVKLAERKAKEQAREDSLARRRNYQSYVSTYEGAMRTSSRAHTMNEEIQAIKNLEAARGRLSQRDKDYETKLRQLNSEILRHKESIDKARQGASRLEENHRRLMNTSEQLGRRLALLFSVSAITGYMKKLVQVRGELELQQVALQSILRDKEKANEVWAQIQQLALQSPFTLMQLTAYTKQLAAYQVESDRLVETTKRLADVSAGLGVDMGRIILAFGQVKAANYLRSAEVRQFTEAGINMLGELSKLYTELEGKMVSVGDVQERITKRMVSFGDVEEVFNRLTSAGGMFYNMQEKQSETLRGMVAKLTDAFDIMLNQIGESNEGALKGFVQMAIDLVQNWRKFGDVAVPILNTLIARFLIIKAGVAAAFAVSTIQIFIKNMQALIAMLKDVKFTLDGIKTASSLAFTAVGGWAGLVTIIASITLAVYGLIQAFSDADKEAEQLNNIFFEQQAAADKSIQNYENLVKVVRDGTKSYKEQQDAMEELKRTYGDIVPAEYLEIKNIQDIKFNYHGATDAIREYYNELSKKKQIELVTGEEGRDASQAANNYIASVMYAIKDLDKSVAAAVDKSEIRQVVAQLQKDIQEGTVTSLGQATKQMQKYLYDLTGNLRVAQGAATYLGNAFLSDSANKNLEDLFNITTALRDRLKEIEDGNYMGNIPTQATKALNATREAFEKYSTSIKESFSTIFSDDATKQQVDAAKKQVEALFKEMGKEMPDWTKAMTDEIYRMQNIKVTFDKALLEKEAKMVSDLLSKVPESGRSTIKKAFEDIQNQMNALDPSPVQRSVNMAIMSFIALNDVAFKGMAKLSMQAGERAEDYFKRIKEGAKTTAQTIKELTGILAMGYLPPWQTQQVNKDLEAAKQQKKLEDYIATLEKSLTVEKQKKTGSGGKKGEDPNQKELQALKERVKLLKEANKEYENNLKYFEKESAVAKTLSAYKNAFKQAGIADFLKQEFLDEEGLVKALEQLPNKVGGKYRDQALQFMADETAKIKVQLEIDDSKKTLDNLKKDIEKMFSDYDLFKSLTEIDFPPELASRIFGVDIVSLEDLKKKIEELKPEFKGEDAEKAYDDFLKKLADKEQKEQLDRIKRYNTYLINAMAERSKVYLEEARQYQEVQDEMSYTDEERERIRRKIHEETAREIAKIDWKDLQESDFFINLYDDINNVSRGAIEEMIAKLRDMQDEMVRAGIPMKDIRAIMGRINDLEKELQNRNPFKNFTKNAKTAVTGLKQLKKLEEERKRLQEEHDTTESDLKALEKEVGLSKQAYENAVNKYGVDSVQAQLAKQTYEASVKSAEELRKKYDQQGQELEENRKKTQAIRKAQEDTVKALNKVGEYGQQIMGITQDVTDMLSSFGIELDDKTQQTFEGIGQFFDGLSSIDVSKPFTVITGSVKAVTGLGKAIGGIFGIGQGDKKREREITREIDLVEKLQKYYEELKEKIESAYSLQTFDRANKLAEENIQQRNDALNRAIEAERRKKKTDESRIEQWQEEIAQNNKELENLQKERLQALGGMGGESTYKDAAQGFVDAWMSAFQETGDGLQALKDNFQDFLNEWFIKQATMRIAGQMLKPLFEMIDAAVGENSLSGSALVREEINAIKERAETLFPVLNESLKELFETMGMVGQGDQTLSGLQKGIEGVSESTAQIIEAYLNSIRFFVADTHDKLAAFLSTFTSNEVAVNPILSELRAQTELIRSINDTFGSIVARGAYREGGSAIRVIM